MNTINNTDTDDLRLLHEKMDMILAILQPNKHPYNPIEQMIDLSSAGIRQQIAALPEGAVTIGVKAEVKYIVPDQPPKTP